VPILRVRNARLSTRYFLEVLGFRKDWEDPLEPGQPLLVSVSRDGVTFYLSERREDGPCGGRANVHVDDARALFEELGHHGARMMSPLDVQSDGSIEFVVQDLDGNVIRFDQIASLTGAPPKPSGRSPRGGSRLRAPRRRKPS
jgi:catechol 2,3-dioxygenase-like lactoylglutathione lyase family enzyme